MHCISKLKFAICLQELVVTSNWFGLLSQSTNWAYQRIAPKFNARCISETEGPFALIYFNLIVKKILHNCLISQILIVCRLHERSLLILLYIVIQHIAKLNSTANLEINILLDRCKTIDNDNIQKLKAVDKVLRSFRYVKHKTI